VTKTPKPAPAPPVDAVELTPLQKSQVDATEYQFPEVWRLTKGEVHGIGVTALEGYLYGERHRYDGQGRYWQMRREAQADVYKLIVTCTVEGVVLAEAAMTLDRLAGAEGEDALLAMVERLVDEAEDVHWAARRYQQATRPEAG
jgi:hypothetical protein